MWAHVNRIKRTNNPEVWRENSTRTRSEHRPSKRRQEDREEEEEDEEIVFTRGPIQIPVPLQAAGQQHRETPDRDLLHILDTPDSELQTGAASNARLADPNYVPPSIPRSRHELRTTRDQPPITRARARWQALQESNQGPEGE
jgi:hypothetical protein